MYNSLTARPRRSWAILCFGARKPGPGHASARNHFQLVSADRCLGAVDKVDLLLNPSRGARLLGWAWDRTGQREVRRIWVVDDAKVIRGMGITGASRPDVGAAFSNRRMVSAGWFAYAQLPARGKVR